MCKRNETSNTWALLYGLTPEDDELVRYDACSERSRHTYSRKVFDYIGIGKIHSINNVRQSFKNNYYFFIYRNEKNNV